MFFWLSKYKLKKNTYAVVQPYLIKYSRLHQIDINCELDTYGLVEQFFLKNPDIFKYNLHHLSVASGTFLLALENCYASGAIKEANFFLFCLGQILIDVEAGENELKLSGYDRKFINGCIGEYQSYSLKLEGSIPDLTNEEIQKDSEFEEKDHHLDIFLQYQESLILIGKDKLQFNNEREMLRYIHFLFGAIDQLSRTIKDNERAELWWTVTATTRASFLVGVDDAFKVFERYGDLGDAELAEAGKRGYFAMQNYILNSIGKCAPEVFNRSSLELFAVVYNKE